MNGQSAGGDYPGFWKRAQLLVRAWIKQPRVVSAITPSSPAVVAAVIQQAPLDQAQRIVDLGAGTGEITTGLLAAMSDTAQLLAVEKSEHLLDTLQRLDDRRLNIVHGDAADLVRLLDDSGMRSADLIVSGIPFSVIPPDVCRQILQQIDQALEPGGCFIAYQLSRKVVQYTVPHFGQYTQQLVWGNLPPLTVYRWQKASAANSA